MNTLFILVSVLLAAFLLFRITRFEGLSLSQFPVPTCSTCKSCKFYTCGKCGSIYQEQNKINQSCDCGGFTVYRTPVKSSCYTQTLKGSPMTGPVKMCSQSEGFRPPVKGSCQSCQQGTYTCLEAAGTFDSGSTFLRNLPCPVPFPPVVSGFKPIAQKQLLHTSELDIFNHLADGGLIIAANKGDTIAYALKTLINQTAAGGNSGYPEFYYIDGPVLIMSMVSGRYYWMTDYPIKYNPENFEKYVGSSLNWKIAQTAFNHGKNLLNQDAPVIFFSADPRTLQAVATAAKCMPIGGSQSSSDYYYPGCASKSCLWGPEYGSGNWLARV